MVFDPSKVTKDGATLEHKSLRDEILLRVRLRQQLLALTVALAGVFLAANAKVHGVGFAYAPLAVFIAIAWSQNDYRVRRAASYLRDVVEPLVGGGWEAYMQADRHRTGRSEWRRTVFSHVGLVAATQVVTTGSGFLELGSQTATIRKDVSGFDWLLFVVDLLAIGFVVQLGWRAGRGRKENPSAPLGGTSGSQ